MTDDELTDAFEAEARSRLLVGTQLRDGRRFTG
jgi:hypothetical protein